jgi:hypothetical protein
MKCIWLLAFLLSVPLARADSVTQIPGPITTFNLSGIQSTVYQPWLYSVMWGSSEDFVSNLFMGSFDDGQLSATMTNEGWLQAQTGNYTFNSQTDTVSGTFVGVEHVWGEPRTTGLRQWNWNVSGTFSEKLSFGTQGTASLNITSASYAGTSAVPEPGTWLLMGTGGILVVSAVTARNRFQSGSRGGLRGCPPASPKASQASPRQPPGNLSLAS